eukprot:2102241-Amphidinium_carterae.1
MGVSRQVLRGKAIECATLMGDAVGKEAHEPWEVESQTMNVHMSADRIGHGEVFQSDASELMHVSQNTEVQEVLDTKWQYAPQSQGCKKYAGI